MREDWVRRQASLVEEMQGGNAMMYVEFIERDRTMPIEIFRQLGDQASGWHEGAKDRMVLQLGRTLRLGPSPSYLCFWQIPGIERLDGWEEYFHSPSAAANRRSQAMHRAIHIQRAGLYDELAPAGLAVPGLYVIEYCEPEEQAESSALAAAMSSRSSAGTTLVHLLRRVGRAGPDASLLAVWRADSYVAIEPMLRRPPAAALGLVAIGIYRPFGDEIL
jgi:hypothetical protein